MHGDDWCRMDQRVVSEDWVDEADRRDADMEMEDGCPMSCVRWVTRGSLWRIRVEIEGLPTLRMAAMKQFSLSSGGMSMCLGRRVWTVIPDTRFLLVWNGGWCILRT